jgi:very-short-patch-repair endonuclease
MIGSVYLSKNNEIAIWVKKYQKDHKMIIRKKILQEILTKFRRKKYFANMNPRNKKLVNFYKKNGFKLIYFTFEIKGKKDENVKPNDKKRIEILKKNGYNIAQHVYCFLK